MEFAEMMMQEKLGLRDQLRWRSGLWLIGLALCLVIVVWWGSLSNETARWLPAQSRTTALPKGRETDIVEISNKVFIRNKPINPQRSTVGEENTVFAFQIYSSVSDRIAQNLVRVDHFVKASYIPIGGLFREDFFDSPVDVQLSDPQRRVPNVPDSNPQVTHIGRGSGVDLRERPDVSRTSFGFAESEIEVEPPAFGTSDNLRLQQRGIGAFLSRPDRSAQELCLDATGYPKSSREDCNQKAGNNVDKVALPDAEPIQVANEIDDWTEQDTKGAATAIFLCALYAFGLWLAGWGVLNTGAADRAGLARAAGFIGSSIVATWLVIAGTWWLWGYLLSQL